MQPDLPCRILIQSENAGITYSADCGERFSNHCLYLLRAAFGVKVLHQSNDQLPQITRLTNSMALRIFAALLAVTICLPLTLIGIACALLSKTHDEFSRSVRLLPAKPVATVNAPAPAPASLNSKADVVQAAADTLLKPATNVTAPPATQPAPANQKSPSHKKTPPSKEDEETPIHYLLHTDPATLQDLAHRSNVTPNKQIRVLVDAAVQHCFTQPKDRRMYANQGFLLYRMQIVLGQMTQKEFVACYREHLAKGLKDRPVVEDAFINAALEMRAQSKPSGCDPELSAVLTDFFKSLNNTEIARWLPILSKSEHDFVLSWKSSDELLQIAELMLYNDKVDLSPEIKLGIWNWILSQALKDLPHSKAPRPDDAMGAEAYDKQIEEEHQAFMRKALAILAKYPETFFWMYSDNFKGDGLFPDAIPRSLMTPKQIELLAKEMHRIQPQNSEILLDLAVETTMPSDDNDMMNLADLPHEYLLKKMQLATTVPLALGVDPQEWVQKCIDANSNTDGAMMLATFITFGKIREIMLKVPSDATEATLQREQLAKAIGYVGECDEDITHNFHKLLPQNMESFKLFLEGIMLAAPAMQKKNLAKVRFMPEDEDNHVPCANPWHVFAAFTMSQLVKVNHHDSAKVQSLFRAFLALHTQCVGEHTCFPKDSSCLTRVATQIKSLQVLGLVVDAALTEPVPLNAQGRNTAVDLLVCGEEFIKRTETEIYAFAVERDPQLTKEIEAQGSAFSPEGFVQARVQAIEKVVREALPQATTGLTPALVDTILCYYLSKHAAA